MSEPTPRKRVTLSGADIDAIIECLEAGIRSAYNDPDNDGMGDPVAEALVKKLKGVSSLSGPLMSKKARRK